MNAPAKRIPRPPVRIDLDRVRTFMHAPLSGFSAFGTETQTKDGVYYYADHGSNVLAVAHLDTVQAHYRFAWDNQRPEDGPKSRTRVYAAQCDDRLGAYVIANLLPKLGVRPDLLLTEGEERGRSTARHFVAPEGKKYHWIFSFDRAGQDVVLYQYETPETRRLVDPYCRVGVGSYSDIADLERLGVLGLNWGTGYYDNHGAKAYFVVEELETQVEKFLKFWDDHHLNHIPVTPVHRYARWTGWTGWTGLTSEDAHDVWKDYDPYGYQRKDQKTTEFAPREPYPAQHCRTQGCTGVMIPTVREQGYLRWSCTGCKDFTYSPPTVHSRAKHRCPSCKGEMDWSQTTNYDCHSCKVRWTYYPPAGVYTESKLSPYPTQVQPQPLQDVPKAHAPKARKAPKLRAPRCPLPACGGELDLLDADEEYISWQCIDCGTIVVSSKSLRRCDYCYRTVRKTAIPNLYAEDDSLGELCMVCLRETFRACRECGQIAWKEDIRRDLCPECQEFHTKESLR